MEYFKLLELAKEPFSNSPDPGFFYESAQHKECLQKLEIAIRLRRGLNVVTGEVGTGKTTLCRQLIQSFSADPAISASLLLDPDVPDARAFLGTVVHTVTGRMPAPDTGIPVLKEQLKQYLFQKGVEENHTTLLIVDEGQKISPASLEILRELLNFETNEHKLFQVIIFAQNELSEILDRLPNLADRINLYYRLGPLDYRDTRALVRHRIRLAGGSDATGRRLFSRPALHRIFRLSGGYPRKIIHLCHQCLLAMIIQNKTSVDRRMVNSCARRTFLPPRPRRLLPAATVVVLAALGLAWHYTGRFQSIQPPSQNTGDNAVAALLPAETFPTEEKESSAADIEANETGTNPANAPGIHEINTVSPAPPVQEEAIATENEAILGTVTVAVGDTLGDLVQKVYGAYTYRFHEAILAANPRLKDPDSLVAGQPLNFPALSADTTNMPGTTWWISLSRKPDLKTAMATLRKKTMAGFPLRILALRTPDEGLCFRIVLKTCLESEREAEFAKEQLVLSPLTTPEVFCLKKEETMVYGFLGI
jgi:general secretion pathway protein A